MYRADLKSSIKAKNNWNLYLVSQFSHSVMSNTLQPYEPQHARPPCPSSTPRVHPNSYPLSQWCHSSIPSSVVSFSSRFQSFPTSGSFPMSHFFAAGGQSIGVSASASVLPMNIQDWFPLELTALISLQSQGIILMSQHQFIEVSHFRREILNCYSV